MCTPCLNFSDNSQYKIRDPKVINNEEVEDKICKTITKVLIHYFLFFDNTFF